MARWAIGSILLAAIVSVALSACRSESDSGNDELPADRSEPNPPGGVGVPPGGVGVPPASSSSSSPVDRMPRYTGLEFEVSIEVMMSFPEQYAATYMVVVPTGGWRLTEDRADWDDATLKLYATLEKPGADEVVTQALETLRGRHQAGTRKIGAVELYVRHIQRNADNSDAEYILAANAPD